MYCYFTEEKKTYKEYEVEYKQEDFDAFGSSFHSHDLVSESKKYTFMLNNVLIYELLPHIVFC